MSFALPPPLRRGAPVRVIAPAGPCEARLLWRGMGWLAEHYRVRYDRGIFSRQGYLAGSDERRRSELEAALADDVQAIFCARGGYGISRYAHRVDCARLRSRWLVGFSDVTALHVEAMRLRVASIHGPNVTGLGRGDARGREQLLALLAGDLRRRYDDLEVLRPGSARGPLCGGNLTLLHACAAAGRLALPPGAVLLLEDVAERPYRIDRMISTLVAGGHLAGVAGVVIGELDGCDPAPDGVTALAAACEALAPLAVPVLAGLTLGHGTRNDPVVLGATAEISGRSIILG